MPVELHRQGEQQRAAETPMPVEMRQQGEQQRAAALRCTEERHQVVVAWPRPAGHWGRMTAARACWSPAERSIAATTAWTLRTSATRTVDDFYLDKYEITVGRFRQFVKAGMGTQASPPASGAGANLAIPGSGWDSTWNTNLPADTTALTAAISCGAPYQTWTNTAGSNESQPVNSLDWYTASAFCSWDGGRLPTEAEWNYAASGGNEQRYYPWSSPPTSTTIDDSYAVYCDGSCVGTRNVGSKSPKGDGKWGQSDLAGNVWEWTLDWFGIYQTPCDNCADIADAAASYRVLRGGNFYYYASNLRSASRNYGSPRFDDSSLGARCARTSL